MNKISVIILNYKLPEMTCECIKSIIANTENIDYEIILVDNGSQDNSRKVFNADLAEIQNIKIIYSERNLGYGCGNNLGIESASGEYLFILNNDTIFYENSLSILLKKFQELSKKDKIGFIQPRLYLNKGKTVVQQTNTETPTIFKVFQENIKILQKIRRERYEEFRYSDWDRNSSRYVDTVCGAAMFCKKNFFEEMGKFDKRFFLYFEEYDICKRAKESGYSSYYTVETGIIHLHNMSPRSSVGRKLIYIISFVKFITKRRDHNLV